MSRRRPRPLGGTRVGRSFVLLEFRSGDGELVPDEAVPELQELVAELLQPLRDRFGVTRVLSGHRSATHNLAVGGAVQSFHRYDLKPGRGVAADVRCSRGRPVDWHRFLDAIGAGGLGLYDGFVHVDTRRDRARWTG